MVDDTRLGDVVYVNGQGQVWAWTGHTWHPVAREGAPQIPAPGAPTRQPQQAFAAGYDQTTGDLVIARSARTWFWDGSRWSSDPGGIDASDEGPGAQLIDDLTRNEMVYPGTQQTWTWAGAGWQHLPHGALPSGSLAYDPATQRTVLVAPEDTHCSKAGCLATTWTWDGIAWTHPALFSAPHIPVTRYSSTPPPAVYDAALGGLMLLVSAN